ncbi:MAG: pantoate--beta-alanine ligase [Sphingomonadales bacterium]
MTTQPSSVPVVRTVDDLRDQVRAWRADRQRVALVPTMGALHHGHLSIVHLARQHADRVVVSIFVNPKQFGPGEDFDRYPRQEDDDRRKLEEAATDLLYAPTPPEMYPDGFATTVSVRGVTEGLCGGARPGHFDGVTTVVTKLLLQCLPDVALFGEKDYQQYLTLKHLVRDLDIPLTVLPAPIVRDADGLATSSRNVYLSPAERSVALTLPATLNTLVEALGDGRDAAPLLAEGVCKLKAAGFDPVDYLELRDAETLVLVDRVRSPARILAAAHVGRTRLIDNMAVLPKS